MKFFSFIIGSIISITAIGQSPPEKVNDAFSEAEMRSHIYFLTSDALKGRNTGSQGIEAAASYLSAQFMREGVLPFDQYADYHQYFSMLRVLPPDSSKIYVGDTELNYPNDFIILNGDTRNMSTESVFVNFGMQEDLEGKDVRLKVLIAYCGNGVTSNVQEWVDLSMKKREWAKEAGAVGLIEIYKSQFIPWTFLKNYASQERVVLDTRNADSGSFPHHWLGTSNDEIVSTLVSGPSKLKFELEGLIREPFKTANVLGFVPGTDPDLRDEYIIYTAHYDHVGEGRADASGDNIYNGARDNAVGTTAVLMLSKYLAENPVKRSSIFVLFTGEEKGLLGSEYFVDHPVVDLQDIKYCLNIDNSGYNDTTAVTVIGLKRTEAEEYLVESGASYGLEVIEDSAKEQGFFDRSDNVNFARKGIPAPTFSLGFRSFDAEIMKYYHQPGDEYESLNLPYIEKYIKSFILSAVKIGNSDSAPFWIKGDKYYEAGVNLYGADD